MSLWCVFLFVTHQKFVWNMRTNPIGCHTPVMFTAVIGQRSQLGGTKPHDTTTWSTVEACEARRILPLLWIGAELRFQQLTKALPQATIEQMSLSFSRGSARGRCVEVQKRRQHHPGAILGQSKCAAAPKLMARNNVSASRICCHRLRLKLSTWRKFATAFCKRALTRSELAVAGETIASGLTTSCDLRSFSAR